MISGETGMQWHWGTRPWRVMVSIHSWCCRFNFLAVLPISLLAMSLPMAGSCFRWFNTKLFKNYSGELLHGKLFCSPVPWKVMSSIASWSRILELRKGQLILLLPILFDLRWRSPPEQPSGLESSFFKRSYDISLAIMTAPSAIQSQEKDKPVRQKRKLLLS